MTYILQTVEALTGKDQTPSSSFATKRGTVSIRENFIDTTGNGLLRRKYMLLSVVISPEKLLYH